MFRVYMTNFNYFYHKNFDYLRDAIVHSKLNGFETTIYEGNQPIGSYSPISGYHEFVN